MKKKSFFNKYKISITIVIILLLSEILFVSLSNKHDEVLIKTNKGDIVIELYENKAPITVENFKTYVNEGFYSGLVFHRVIKDFMVQGGGFEINGVQKETRAPIVLESNNGLSNEKYTIAMARTNSPNSATSQFFINTNDNTFLDYGLRDQGYAVFGKVVKGFDVVDEIENSQTTTKYGYMKNWPVEDIIIESVTIL